MNRYEIVGIRPMILIYKTSNFTWVTLIRSIYRIRWGPLLPQDPQGLVILIMVWLLMTFRWVGGGGGTGVWGGQ